MIFKGRVNPLGYSFKKFRYIQDLKNKKIADFENAITDFHRTLYVQ